MVERPAVNGRVVGSNPTRGALIEIEQEIARFLFYSLGFLRFESDFFGHFLGKRFSLISQSRIWVSMSPFCEKWEYKYPFFTFRAESERWRCKLSSELVYISRPDIN